MHRMIKMNNNKLMMLNLITIKIMKMLKNKVMVLKVIIIMKTMILHFLKLMMKKMAGEVEILTMMKKNLNRLRMKKKTHNLKLKVNIINKVLILILTQKL